MNNEDNSDYFITFKKIMQRNICKRIPIIKLINGYSLLSGLLTLLSIIIELYYLIIFLNVIK